MKRITLVATVLTLGTAGLFAFFAELRQRGDENATSRGTVPRETHYALAKIDRDADSPSASGRLIDGEGAPVAGATVMAYRRASQTRSAGSTREIMDRAASGDTELAAAAAITDSTGAFRFEDLPPEPFELWVDAGTAFAFAEIQPPAAGLELRLEPGVMLRGRVELRWEPPPEGTLVGAIVEGFPRPLEALTGPGGRFTLGPLPSGHAITVATDVPGFLGAPARTFGSADEVVLTLSRARRIAGVVLAAGMPVAGARVSAEPETWGIPGADCPSDADGRFACSEMAAGEVWISATRGELAGRTLVDVPPGHDLLDVEVDLEEACAVQVLARDEGGAPVRSGTVHLEMVSEDRMERTVTLDARGQALVAELPCNPVVVTVEGEGLVPAAAIPELTPHAVVDVVLTLQSGPSIAGVVLDSKGRPIAGAKVAAENEGITRPELIPPVKRAAVTDERGAFTLAHLLLAKTRLDVTLEGYLPASLRLDDSLRDGLRIQLRKAAELRVRVEDAEGQPLGGADVFARSEDDKGHGFGEHLGRGLYRVRDLAPGAYRVEASWHQMATGVTQVAMAEGEQKEATIQLSKLASLSGRVVSPAGAPIAGAQVNAWLSGERDPIASTESRPDGTFAMQLAPGDFYQLGAALRAHRPVSFPRVEAGGPPITLVLEEPATLTGRVLRPGGSPSPTFFLNGERRDAPDGRFELQVEAGEYALAISAPTLTPAHRSGQSRSGEAISLGDVVLERGVTVALRVEDAERRTPLRGAKVRLAERELRTPTSGRVELPDVAVGSTASVMLEGYESCELEIRDDRELVAALRPLGGLLRVHVGRLEPARPGNLWLLVDGGQGWGGKPVRVPPGGVVDVRGLSEGEYVLTVWLTLPEFLLPNMPIPAPIVPARVRLPASGTLEISMPVRDGPAQVGVDVVGGDPTWRITPLLIDAAYGPPPTSIDGLFQGAWRIVVPSNPQQRSAEFAAVAPGAYHVVMVVEDGDDHVVVPFEQGPVTVRAGGQRIHVPLAVSR